MIRAPSLPRLRRPRGPRLFWLTADLAFSRAPRDAEWRAVRQAGIRCVLDLRAEAHATGSEASAEGLLYLRAPVPEGGVPLDSDLSLLADWIDQSVSDHGPVLVHCREGLGRSPLVACAALVAMGVPVREAYAALRRARPEVSLSDEQAGALERFASRLESGRPAA
jgi:protein-tyrosine phosphatase